MINFANWLVSQFPNYFYFQDTYKDINGKGLWQRYVEIFGKELDENFRPFVESLTELVTPRTIPASLVTYLSDNLGSPPDIFSDTDADFSNPKYRSLLSYITKIYQIKGTVRSYELLFEFLGYGVRIIEQFDESIAYDNGDLYDVPLNKYDNECPGCISYILVYYPITENVLNSTPIVIGELELNKIRRVIDFIEPIDTKLKQLVRGYLIRDTVGTDISETILKNTFTLYP